MNSYVDKAKHQVRRVSKSCLNGQDRPFPRRKCMGNKVALMEAERAATARIGLRAGSVLAKRSPHLYGLQTYELQTESSIHGAGGGSD